LLTAEFQTILLGERSGRAVKSTFLSDQIDGDANEEKRDAFRRFPERSVRKDYFDPFVESGACVAKRASERMGFSVDGYRVRPPPPASS